MFSTLTIERQSHATCYPMETLRANNQGNPGNAVAPQVEKPCTTVVHGGNRLLYETLREGSASRREDPSGDA